MYIEAKGLICDTTKRSEAQSAASFVGLSIASSGSIFCTFQIGPGKNAPTSRPAIFRSDDQGSSWRPLTFRFNDPVPGIRWGFASGQIAEVTPGKLLLASTWFDRSQPDRPLFDPVTEGLLPSKQFLACSFDQGETWSAWQEVPTPGIQGCSSTGPLLVWSDRLIGFPVESLKQFDDLNPAVPGAWCLLSRDGARTFEPPILIARDPSNTLYFWDQRLAAGPVPGEFIGLFWTYDRAEEKDLKIHILHSTLLNGASGNRRAASPTPLTGQIAAPVWLKNGRILAFAVDRTYPGSLTLWSSNDLGESWPESLLVYQHIEHLPPQADSPINYAEYWKAMGQWSFGHPAIVPVGEEKILLAYYAGVPDRTSIHWARVNLN